MKIAFVGTVNAMPMAYALQFKNQKYDVKYIVDVPRTTTLSRPECHYDEIGYPYPSWVIEIIINRPSVKTILPSIFFKRILNEIGQADVYFLCDWYISLAPYLPKKSKIIILPHGADLDTWCDPNKADEIAKVGVFSKLWKIKTIFAKLIISNMRKGLTRADIITYYPKGLNPDGDALISEFEIRNNSKVIRRYDVNFSSARNYSGSYKNRIGPLKLCSAVRFDFIPIEGIKNGYLKGNDLIIKAIGKFYREFSTDIEVTFFKKGADLAAAQTLCIGEGIQDVVRWNDTVPFNSLLEIINKSDICFDQVGHHWVGAVGVFSMFLGKPLIANFRPEILADSLIGDNPIMQASTVDEIYMQLVKLSDDDYRRELSRKSRLFSLENFSSEVVYQKYLNAIVC